jgi:hypothetical protein
MQGRQGLRRQPARRNQTETEYQHREQNQTFNASFNNNSGFRHLVEMTF